MTHHNTMFIHIERNPRKKTQHKITLNAGFGEEILIRRERSSGSELFLCPNKLNEQTLVVLMTE